MENKVSIDYILQVKNMFREMGCAQLYDAAAKYSFPLEPSIMRRTPGLILAGPAFPVQTANDMLPCLQALEMAPEGWVIVVHNTLEESEALAGDIYITAAKYQKLGGLVVDGAIRDIDGIKDLGVPTFSKSVNFVSAKTAKVPAARVPEEISFGKNKLEPGDWIFGDGDGLLVIKEKYLSAALASASVLLKMEKSLKETLSKGERFADVCGLNDFLSNKGPLKFEI